MMSYPDSIHYLCNVATVAQNMGFYLSLNPLKISLIWETNTHKKAEQFVKTLIFQW